MWLHYVIILIGRQQNLDLKKAGCGEYTQMINIWSLANYLISENCKLRLIVPVS